MDNTTIQFITQMKLSELQRQRDRLRAAYRQLQDDIARSQATGERLRTLYIGLRELSIAGRRLHPEVANLEVLLYQLETGAVAPSLLTLWQKRLEDELKTGATRSEFIFLFGALLEEWLRESQTTSNLLEENHQIQSTLSQAALTPAVPNRHEEIIAPLLDQLDPALSSLATSLETQYRESILAPIQDRELSSVLHQLSMDIYQSRRSRNELRQFIENEMLRRELADTLTLLIAGLDKWDWLRGGISTRALWTRNKWRLYLDVDVLTACLFEILAARWAEASEQVIYDKSAPTDHRAKLRNLVSLKNPERWFERDSRSIDQEWTSLVSLFEDDASSTEVPEPGSVNRRHEFHQWKLRTIDPASSYTEAYLADQAVLLVKAEIQLAKATFGDHPVFVVKVDLQDYYSSIPHDVIATILRRLRLPEGLFGFLTRYIAPPLRDQNGQPARMQNGVPMGFALSDILGELLMRLLERHIRQHLRIQVIRMRDDICILTPRANDAVAAWQHINEFCNACGLSINHNKSGSVGLGGSLPAGLPAGLPRWGMLELNENGDWQVHQASFEAHLAQSRARVNAAGSVLTRVRRYSSNAKFLINALALGTTLGDVHRKAVADAIQRFHNAFFSDQQGIVAGLRQEIRRRFLSEGEDTTGIPEGWLYWPITAGGLGLRNPLVIVGQYGEAYRQQVQVARPTTRSAEWVQTSEEWGQYYNYLLRPLHPIEPENTNTMESLVTDFISRGKAVSAGKQKGLTSYWKWILHTYGPEILQRFGMFGLLITELVPLQLIQQQILQDTSLDDGI